MNRDKSTMRGVLLVAMMGSFVAACELALDFDRTKIDGGAIDASFGDTATADRNVPPVEGGNDGASDTGPDAPAVDASDAGADTGTADTGTEPQRR